MAAKSVFVLEPDDISNGAFHVTIKPVSSMPGETLQGVEFELKKMLPNPRLPDLWTSFDISVAIDGTSSNNFQSKTLQQINGKITEANFFPVKTKNFYTILNFNFAIMILSFIKIPLWMLIILIIHTPHGFITRKIFQSALIPVR